MAVLTDTLRSAERVQVLDGRGILVSISSLLAWLGLFAAGLIIPSSPYRQALASEGAVLALGDLFRNWIIVMCCYTLTNVALLCCFASLLGAAGQEARLEREEGPSFDAPGNPYVSALIRGFFVYLVLLSGVLILLEKPFESPSPEQYLRLAGFISLLSFLVGYNPGIFSRLLKRIADLVEGHPSGSQS